MLKCVNLLISSILKKVAVTLTQLHAREEEKNMGFLLFCLRTDITLLVLKHHCLTLVWSWEKNYVKMCHFLLIS